MNMSSKQMTKAILSNDCASFWLKHAIEAALLRDPVDSLYDAKALVQLLELRLAEIQRGVYEDLSRRTPLF